jgi:hypothetical protein
MLKALWLAVLVAFGAQTAQAMVDAMPNNSDDSTRSQSTEPWYILATKVGQCRLLHAMFDVDTPQAVMTLFADHGQPLEVAGNEGDYILLKLAGQPKDPGMALVRGQGPCNEFLKLMQAVGK